MGSQPDPWTIPPTELQLDAMCLEAAAIARSWGWNAGDQMRERIRRFLNEPELPGEAEPKPARLAFRSATTINANGSSWALAADLLARYEIPN